MSTPGERVGPCGVGNRRTNSRLAALELLHYVRATDVLPCDAAWFANMDLDGKVAHTRLRLAVNLRRQPGGCSPRSAPEPTTRPIYERT